MLTHAAPCFLVLLLGLTVKFALLIAVQGIRRIRSQTFRWSEDAAHWGGVAGSEDGLVERAQAALRNDGESQPLFLAASALWLWSGATLWLSICVISVYLVARCLHSVSLIWPRQPLRNRVFGLSQLCLMLVLADSCRMVFGR